jgi:hypothetical protein
VEMLRSGAPTNHPKVHRGVKLLGVPKCKKVLSDCKARLRLDLTQSGGDPRDPEEINAEAVRLASSFPESSSPTSLASPRPERPYVTGSSKHWTCVGSMDYLRRRTVGGEESIATNKSGLPIGVSPRSYLAG